MATRSKIKKTGRTWGVYIDGQLVEGGFFSYEAARAAAETYTLAPCHCGNSEICCGDAEASLSRWIVEEV